MTRTGVLAGGNVIIDHVKLIDRYPEQDMLAFIQSEASSSGGGPYNVLQDLAAMQEGYPLEAAKAAGLLTSVDLVSAENEHFRLITEAALPFTDHLIVNEIEAGKVVEEDLKSACQDIPRMRAAAKKLLERGVRREVIIHFEAGAVVAEKSGAVHHQASLQLPPGFIAGATGAGDAFAAGYLHGTHEEWPIAERLWLAVCTAAACLTHPTPSQGLRPVAECLDLMRQLE